MKVYIVEGTSSNCSTPDKWVESVWTTLDGARDNVKALMNRFNEVKWMGAGEVSFDILMMEVDTDIQPGS